MTITTIPAQPGFDLVDLFEDKFHYYPVVAWTIETYVNKDGSYVDSKAHPICMDLSFNGLRNTNIRRPDGAIEFSDGSVFLKGHEQEALEFAKQQEAKRAA